VSRIYFNNITATSENGCFVGGDVAGKVSDIFFNNVRVRLTPNTKHLTPSMDKRPCKGEGFIKADLKAMKAMKVPLVTENATVNVQ
jgi:hypothetical protein